MTETEYGEITLTHKVGKNDLCELTLMGERVVISITKPKPETHKPLTEGET